MQDINYLNLSGRLLRLFLAIYDTNSVSAAAARLDLNQSTVSHSLDKLRDLLGDPLFIKSGRGITPTERAIIVAPYAREILADMEGIVSHITYNAAEDDSPITIAANIESMTSFFIKLREEVARIAPNKPLRLIELGARANILSLLDDNKVDLVITVRAIQYSASLNTSGIITDEFACFYDPNHRAPIETMEDYAAARHAIIDFGFGSKSIMEETLEKIGVSRNVMLFAPSFRALADMIEGSDLVATMRSQLKHSHFGRLAISPPPFVAPPTHIDMVWHRRAERSGRNLWLRNLCIKCADSLKHFS